MKKPSSIALALALAVALSTGGVLVPHRPPTHQAPGAYSDIFIVEDDSQRAAPAGEKAAVPTDIPQSVPENLKMSGPTSPDQGNQGDTNKRKPASDSLGPEHQIPSRVELDAGGQGPWTLAIG
jgi:hypothetical protein